MSSGNNDRNLKSGHPRDIEPASLPIQLESPASQNAEDSHDPFLDQTQHGPIPTDESENSVPAVEDKNHYKRPDGGYGWFIVFGSFIMHIIIGGLDRSEGIFFLQFQARFHQNAQLSAWPGAISSSIRLLSGPLATALGNQYSIRTCCMFGSVLHFTGLVLTSFAPNFYFLFLSHSLLLGLGRGFLYSPSLVILNMYFDTKLSRSSGLACSGVGMGSFLIVPLVQYLFDTYGYTGAFLVISALSMNSVVVAMLFRPLTLYYKFINCERQSVKASKERDGRGSTSDISKPPIERHSLTEQSINPEPDGPESVNCLVNNCKDCVTSISQICLPKEDSDFVRKGDKKIFHFYLLKDPPFLLFCLSIMLFTAAFKSAFTFFPALVKSKGYTDTEAALVISVAGVSDTISRIVAGFLFDFDCLRPLRAMFYNVWIFALAVISCVLPFLNSYTAFCIVVSFYGAFSGAFISQKAVMSVEVLGPENMAASFGILVCFQGIGTTFGPPLAGATRDIFGSFNEAFYFGGALMCLAGVMMVCSNILFSFKRRNSTSANTNTMVLNVVDSELT